MHAKQIESFYFRNGTRNKAADGCVSILDSTALSEHFITEGERDSKRRQQVAVLHHGKDAKDRKRTDSKIANCLSKLFVRVDTLFRNTARSLGGV